MRASTTWKAISLAPRLVQRLRILVPLLSILMLCASVASAAPDKSEANKHFAAGLRLYAEKDFQGAAEELSLAYELRESQRTLFAWAQAERLLGNCDKSRELLSMYIANGAKAKQSRAAYKLMEQCTPRVASEPVSEPEPAVVDPVATGEPPGETDTSGVSGSVTAGSRAESSPWYRDWLGLGMLSAGAVGLAVGGYSYADALTLEESAKAEGVSYEKFLSLKAQAEDQRLISVIAGAAGGVLVGASVVYMVMGESSESEQPSLSLYLDQGRAGMSFSGKF